MIKKYSIKELSSILGCSLTAVSKKIKPDAKNPKIKRYRNVYETVVENNTTYILLDDDAIEAEKKRSKGFKTLLSNGVNNVSDEGENEDVIDIEPIQQENQANKFIEFTQRYINDYTTLQKTFYEEMREKDRQILLLTTSESNKEAEYFEVQAQNKQLKKQNNVLTISLTVAITFCITFIITFCVFYFTKAQNNAETTVLDTKTVGETFNPTFSKNPATVVTPLQDGIEKENLNQPLPAPHNRRNNQRK